MEATFQMCRQYSGLTLSFLHWKCLGLDLSCSLEGNRMLRGRFQRKVGSDGYTKQSRSALTNCDKPMQNLDQSKKKSLTRLYIDHVYRKIAELATFLAGFDLPKSPLGWVRLQTLQSYDGRDVPGNFNPTTQNVIATNKFSILSQGNLRPMSRRSWKPSSSSTLRPRGGDAVSNMPLTVFRHAKAAAPLKNMLSASHQPPRPLQGLKVLPHHFCSDSMLEPLKRYGINPKTRSRDGYAVKLHPLASCDQQAVADVLANSTLRGPQADTLLLVDIPESPMQSAATSSKKRGPTLQRCENLGARLQLRAELVARSQMWNSCVSRRNQSDSIVFVHASFIFFHLASVVLALCKIRMEGVTSWRFKVDFHRKVFLQVSFIRQCSTLSIRHPCPNAFMQWPNKLISVTTTRPVNVIRFICQLRLWSI